ncbi:hypothetical protein [Methylohalobius crimeensis]|uniref:hypothetical protein n=1 Tax=Methylohalobius crimeensis TaxID=244365 RepID=UPI0003B66520|nr:hypothetical protein [Methylohalobius crimeensis]
MKKLRKLAGAGILACFTFSAWGVDHSDPPVKTLLEKLEERDRLISDLQRRVTHLEKLVGEKARKDSPPTEQARRHQEVEKKPATDHKVAQATPPPKPKKQKGGAGSFEVDEEAAEHALERTLTQVGALLLPFGRAEIQPFFVYTRQEFDRPILFVNEEGQLQGVGSREIKQDRFNSGIFSRLGLPMDAQLELSIPYTIVDRTLTNTPSFNTRQSTERKDSASHLGDIQVGIAKTLFRERKWRPDLIARLTWFAPTGRRIHDGVELGGGFHRLRGSLTALKRQDPLAFTGSFFYEGAFDENNNNPGDRFGFSVGALLAASPETSLSISIEQSFIDEVKLNGRTIKGSDRVSSSFVFGASSILGRGFLLSVFGGIGLTEDAPDYFINVSVPLRFNMPFVR